TGSKLPPGKATTRPNRERGRHSDVVRVGAAHAIVHAPRIPGGNIPPKDSFFPAGYPARVPGWESKKSEIGVKKLWPGEGGAHTKSRTGSLYHLSHGQREPDGFLRLRRIRKSLRPVVPPLPWPARAGSFFHVPVGLAQSPSKASRAPIAVSAVFSAGWFSQVTISLELMFIPFFSKTDATPLAYPRPSPTMQAARAQPLSARFPSFFDSAVGRAAGPGPRGLNRG